MVEIDKNLLAARGALERFTLAKLLLQIYETKISARMHLQSDQGVAWIQFSHGFPVSTQIANAALSLGMILREFAALDDQKLNAYLMQLAKKGKSHIEVLLDMGVDQKQLDRGLGVQLIRRVNELFNWQTGTYWLEEGAFDPDWQIATQPSPYLLVYNGIKNTHNEQELNTFLQERLAGRSVRISQSSENIQKHLQLPPEELADINGLADFRSASAFIDQAKSGGNIALLLLFILDQCGWLELGDEDAAQPFVSDLEEETIVSNQDLSQSQSADKFHADAVGTKLRHDLKEKIEQIQANDQFALLGISPQTQPDEIKKAFVQMTKKYHPDRVASFNDQDLQNVCSFVFGKINEAYAILSNSKARAALIREMHIKSDGKLEPDPEEALLEYEKAKVYLNKKNYPQAAQHFYLASRLNPQKTDYQAHYLWYDTFSEPDPDKERLLRAKQQLSKMFQEAPGNFYVNRYLCLILNKLGDDAGYAKHLKKANYINPNDIETAREFRLLNIRKQKQSKHGGLSFFKKSKR